MRNVLDGIEEDDEEGRAERASCNDEHADVSSQPVL